MALSTETQNHLDSILAAAASELAGLSDRDFVRDRPKLNIRDRLVLAIDAAVATEDFSDVGNPGGND